MKLELKRKQSEVKLTWPELKPGQFFIFYSQMKRRIENLSPDSPDFSYLRYRTKDGYIDVHTGIEYVVSARTQKVIPLEVDKLSFTYEV
jgi:hypothetical protein